MREAPIIRIKNTSRVEKAVMYEEAAERIVRSRGKERPKAGLITGVKS